ncbi:hypothetical protein N8I77_003285 [Diaporthe amygdali]|uniref:Uncharacterized protein n=1 Tax=Phomopsis amygdali TaxID=1214568 RepID=A0AAD9W5M7_PHOAM|nr:hypothetical protein N8I77_003285 [Diaporthe amygdali]
MNIVTEMREVCPHDLFLHTEYMATERRTLSRAQMHTPPLSSPVKPGCQAKPGPPRPGQIEAICNHHSPWKQIEYRLHEQDLFQDRYAEGKLDSNHEPLSLPSGVNKEPPLTRPHLHDSQAGGFAGSRNPLRREHQGSLMPQPYARGKEAAVPAMP